MTDIIKTVKGNKEVQGNTFLKSTLSGMQIIILLDLCQITSKLKKGI